MPEQEMPQDLSLRDQVVWHLSEECFNDDLDRGSYAIPTSIMTGLMGGGITYIALKNTLFPAHREYDVVQARIDDEMDVMYDLIDAESVLRGSGQVTVADSMSAIIDQKAEAIAGMEEAKPDNYNPHFEGMVTLTSAFVIGTLLVFKVHGKIISEGAKLRHRRQ